MKKGKIILDFTDFGNRMWKDRLEGGKADDKSPDDFPDDDIEIGTKVEREHTDNPDIATEIALDHLSEDPEYYNKLISSGIADEKDAVDTFDELKGDNARRKAREDIEDFMETDEDEDEEDEDLEDIEDYEEDDLGTDKADIEEDEDEMILDDEEDELKNKKNIMEKKLVKSYYSFIKEAADDPVEQPVNQPPVEAGPERKYSKENKYKFQLPFDQKVIGKLNDYNFVRFVPEGEKETEQPNAKTHFIILDMLNLNYSVVEGEKEDIRPIDPSRLKQLLENL
jgi:hypothetical protein